MMVLTINDWLDIASLLSVMIVLLGGYFLARGFWVNERKAIDLGVSRIAGDIDEENLELPAVKERLKLARDAKIGFTLLACGSVVQIVFIILDRFFG